jgi:hypothetical protein
LFFSLINALIIILIIISVMALIFDVAQKASKVADPKARFELVDLLILPFLNLKP